MSLGIAFKGAEGIVLAADSRVTLLAQVKGPASTPGQAAPLVQVLPAYFDNANKLLRLSGQTHVAAVTYGVGAIGVTEPRTAHSFLPEFDAELMAQSVGRLPVGQFAQRLSDFFMKQWAATMPSTIVGQDMVFLVGGYDEGAPYGRIFEVFIPSKPVPNEMLPGTFGAVWGGQREYTDRILQGYDPRLPDLVSKVYGNAHPDLEDTLRSNLNVPIPYPFLPLQDCVDLSIFLVRTTITLQKWIVGVRGVGGAIDVATITRTDGIRHVQQKEVSGESAIYYP